MFWHPSINSPCEGPSSHTHSYALIACVTKLCYLTQILQL
jgi:hypothetical protein